MMEQRIQTGQEKPASDAWAKITRRWGANGGETIVALQASLEKKPK